jgi:hypothetical protein
MRNLLLAGTLALLLVACTDRPPAEQAVEQPVDGGEPSREMFAGLPVFPGSRLVSGSATAAEALVNVPVSADSVARYYRQALADREWTIRGDATEVDGTVTLHAGSRDGRPIWIRIHPIAPDSCEVSVIATAPTDTASR